MKKSEKNKLIKIILVVLLCILTLLIFKYLPYDKINEWIEKGGVFAPLIYILLFAILPIFLFPVPVLALAGGIAFGLIKGSIYTLIGAAINCMAMFLIARYVGKEEIDKLVDRKLSDNMKKRIYGNDKSIAFFIFILRLIPIVPYNVINYMSGLSNVSLKNYAIASILGIIPGTIVFLNMGDKSSNISSNDFIISVVLLVLLIVFSNLLARYLKKKGKI